MRDIKALAKKYFEENAVRYTEDFYFQIKDHPKWIRHKSILELVEKFVPEKGSKVLDIGCGPGFLAIDLGRKGYVGIGMDISDKMLSIAKKQVSESDIRGWNFLLGDAERTNLEDASFDCVIASGVIEYMTEDSKMLKEINRLLKPGGCLILNVSNLLGYSTSLNFITDRLKKIPGVMKVASKLRKIATNSEYGADQLHFSPRKHFVPNFHKTLGQYGFYSESKKYFHFTFLPAPFSTLTHRFLHKAEAKLDVLDRTPLRIFGATQLICARKVS